jgi:prepilin-type N-terminal cleavage/methylation domain-containing protein
MNINKKIDSRGFTIVELLIVIVVIAILAAITIVAYNGIQQRSHTTSAKTAAENLAKKIEAYNAVNNAYPTSNTATLMTNALNGLTDSSLQGSGITIAPTGKPDAASADSVVRLTTCAGAAQTAGTTVPTGYVIYIWDSTLTAPGLNAVQAGGIGSIAFKTDGTANTVTCTNPYTAG